MVLLVTNGHKVCNFLWTSDGLKDVHTFYLYIEKQFSSNDFSLVEFRFRFVAAFNGRKEPFSQMLAFFGSFYL